MGRLSTTECTYLPTYLALVLIHTGINTTGQSLIHKGSNHGIQKLGGWC